MANHKSSKKRARQIEKRRTHNRYYKKSTRTAIKRLRTLTVAAEATALLPKVVGMIDRLSKMGQFHDNKAANLKSGLAKHVNKLNAPATAA
jgi:small subunit ribosomal protein S20